MKTAEQIVFCAILLLSVQDGFAEKAVLPEQRGTNIFGQTNQSSLMEQTEEKEIIKHLEQQAWQQFCLAKSSETADVQSEAYAKAIKYISDATAITSAPPSTLLLGARIYRHKGGFSYAKNYFARASAVYLDEAMQQPDSIQANLKAAIILYAGDVRYWDTYEESKKNAWNYADKVLTLCKKEKTGKNVTENNEEIFLEEATALALLIKENFAGSNAHFAKAEKLWARETVKTNSVFLKIVEEVNPDVSKETHSYKPYELFKKFPQQGRWYWKVAKQTDASKEFLLNCLTGFYL